MTIPATSEPVEAGPAKPKRRARNQRPVMARAISNLSAGTITPPRLAINVVSFATPSFPKRSVDITQFGAIGNGTHNCGGAINTAIESLHAKGGGTVRIPPGVWFTGRVQLRSNIHLHLDEGAVLRFSDDPRQYLPAVPVRAFGQDCLNYSPLIYAHQSSHIAITGNGVIQGNGERWYALVKPEAGAVSKLYDMVVAGIPAEQRRFGSEAHPIRPALIGLIHCTDVLLDGFSIPQGGPLWTIHLAYCARSTLRNLRIDTTQGPNNDCIVIDSCDGAIIEHCDLNSRDDCIAIKSGLNEDGWRVNRPTENVVIRNIIARGGKSAVTIGSEMSGGARNILISDLQIEGVDSGIRFKAARGRGGVIEKIHIRDVEIRHAVQDAIHLSTDHSAYLSPDGKPPTIRNIVLERIHCRGAKCAARLVGLPDRCIEDILFHDVDLVADEGFCCLSAQRLHLTNARVTAKHGPAFLLQDTRGVFINGLRQPPADRVYLDLRGRLTRDVRLGGEASESIRPIIVLGVDVPRDAVFVD